MPIHQVVTAFVFRPVPVQNFYFYRQKRGWDPVTFLKWQEWAPKAELVIVHDFILLYTPCHPVGCLT